MCVCVQGMQNKSLLTFDKSLMHKVLIKGEGYGHSLKVRVWSLIKDEGVVTH